MLHRLVVLPLLALALAACSAGAGTRGGGGTGSRDGGGGGGSDGGSSTFDGGGTTPPPSDGAVGWDNTCEAIRVEAMPDAPNVLIVLDRSGSMYDPLAVFGLGVDRWTPSVAAINAVTSSMDDRLRFGLAFFPREGALACEAGNVVVPPDLNTSSAIGARLAGDPLLKVGGGTPTSPTLRELLPMLTSMEGTTYVLLVTDGAPNCNYPASGCASCTVPGDPTACTDVPDNCLDDTAAVAAISELAAAGVRTFVIGYGVDASFTTVMDRMAAAGGTGRTSHFRVEDRASVEAALSDISGSVVSCTYELAGPPGDYRYVRVLVDGETVPHESVGGGSGWRLEGDRTVTLFGGACETLSDGASHTIEIRRECEPVLI